MTLSRLLRISRHRARSVARRDRLDAELRREVAFHFDQLVAEFTADGMAPDDARHAAHRALGNVAVVEAQCRYPRRMTWLHDFRQDVIYGLALLRWTPGFPVIASAAPTGSAISTPSASLASARAIATRCFMPPESSCG